MSARLYVGNVPFKLTEFDLKAHFETVGPVLRVDVVLERETARPRGFCFVEMVNEADAQRAIAELNGGDFGGRALTVSVAKARASRSRSAGGRDREWPVA